MRILSFFCYSFLSSHLAACGSGGKTASQMREENSNAVDRCGFASSEALLAEAQKALAALAKNPFDPVFWAQEEVKELMRQGVLARNSEAKAKKETVASKLPWTEEVFSDFEEIRGNPVLAKFRDIDVGNMEIVSAESQDCTTDNFACMSYGALLVMFNEKALENYWESNAQKTETKRRRSLKAVMGHELGHFIVDHYHHGIGVDLPSRDPLHYHLTVDGISMLLNDYTYLEFADSMKRLPGEGDIPERLQCYASFSP